MYTIRVFRSIYGFKAFQPKFVRKIQNQNTKRRKSRRSPAADTHAPLRVHVVCSSGDQLVNAEMRPLSEMVPSRIGSGSGVGGSSRSCSTGSQNNSKHIGGAEDNAEPTPLDQSILASAISSGMPTFLLTKGVSNSLLAVVTTDSRDKGTLLRQVL